MEANRISFMLRATYDVLLSPNNLQQWLGEDPLCSSPASLRHILTGCKVSLSQGRYTWRQNYMLKCLAAAIETKKIPTTTLPFRAQLWHSGKAEGTGKGSFIDQGCTSQRNPKLENVG